MLLSVTGASGSGKSTVLANVREQLVGHSVVCAEFDSVGVPEAADIAWRHGAVEHWVQAAGLEQQEGRHLMLFGQAPVGEILAAPSASDLDGIAACLLHCRPETRRRRLVARGMSEEEVRTHLAFGEWFYGHMGDPTHQPEVIQVPSHVMMRWDRWNDWLADDPRWAFSIVETEDLTPAETASRVATWAEATLAGALPVTRVP